MPFDLDKIDGPGDGVKPPVKSGGFDLDKISNDEQSGSGKLPGAPSGLSFSDFRFQPKTNVDNYLLRAQDQTVWEQLGKGVGNAAANTVTGLVEGFGYLPELFDSSHDYSNALTRKMQEWHNPLGEIYAEHPNQTFDLKDPAWWISNVQQLAESAGAFAIEGVGLGKVFGAMAKGAGELITAGKLGLTGLKVAGGAAQLAAGATLAYTEGAMSGYRIYDDAYKANYDKGIQNGLDPTAADTAAKKIAGNAAATTVQMNTIMNTILNVGELAPLFKAPTDEVLHWIKTTGARAEGESLAAWRTRLKDAAFDNPELKHALMPRHGWSSLAAEAAKEGVEEVNTQYAEHEGRRIAAGQDRNMFTALADMGQYFNDVTNQEGALNFVLGAFGGLAQTAIIDHIPSRYIAKVGEDNKPIYQKGADGKLVYDKNGNPKYQTQLVTPKSYTEFGTKQYFEDVRDSIVSDIDFHEKKRNELLKAKAAGNEAEAEQIKNQIFSVGALDAVSKGLTKSWQTMYQGIASMDNQKSLGDQLQPQIDQLTEQMKTADPDTAKQLNDQRLQLLTQQTKLSDVTEAMQQGFARDMNDNDYKERAETAVQDLKHLQDLHETIQKKYVDPMNEATGELADHLFFRHADLYLRKRAIEREENRIQKNEALENSTHLADATLFDNSIQKYNQHLDVMNGTLAQIKADGEALETADKKGDVKVIKSMIEKYRAKGTSDDDLAGTVNDLAQKIALKVKQYQVSTDNARQQLEDSSGFTAWKEQNPGKTFKDYRESLADNTLLSNDKVNLEVTKVQHQIAEQNLQELTSDKGHTKLMQALAEDRKKLIDGINTRNKNANLDNFLLQQSKQAAARLNLQQKNVLINRYNDQRDSTTKDLNDVKIEKNRAEQDLKDVLNKGKGLFKNLGKVIELREKSKQLKNRISSLEAQLGTINHNLDLLGVQKQEAEIKKDQVDTSTQEELKQEDPNEDVPFDQPDDTEHDPLNDPQQDNQSLKDLAATDEEQSADPVKDYMDLRNELPSVALPILDRLEQEFKDKKPSFQATINAFRQLVNLGLVDQSQVNNTYLKLAAYIADKAKPAEVSPTELVDTPAPSTETLTIDEIPLEISNGQPEINFDPTVFTEEGLENSFYEQGAKTVNAVKANSSDLKYTDIPLNGKVIIRNEMENNGPVLDETANKDRMVPGVISVGDEVTLEMDPNWDGQITDDEGIRLDEDLNNVKVNDSFVDYLDGNGKVGMSPEQYGNVPIKITHTKTGKVIGYFPRADWITQTKGTANYRNVEDLLPADEDGNRTPGNVEFQKELNLKIRRKLAEMYNQSDNAKLTTQVSQRTTGRLMYAGDLNKSTGKVKYKTLLASKLLPDNSLQFGVDSVKDGYLIGKGVKAENTLPLTQITEDERRKTKGAPVVFLPMPDGTYKPSALQTTQFSDRQGDVHTVLRAIELYLQNGTETLGDGQKLIDKIKAHTGFDITSQQGLQDFIQQYYTHTSNFDDTQVNADSAAVQGEGKVQKFMLAIPKEGETWKSPIKVGTSYSGRRPVYANLIDGKLDPKFTTAFTAGIQKRFKNVAFTDGNIRGVNDARPITSILIDKNDNLRSFKYDNYNDYLKSFTYTPVYGLHKVKGRYVYAANSQVILNDEKLTGSTDNIRDMISTPAASLGEVNETAPEDALDALENFSLASIDYTRNIVKPIGDDLNLANLEDLYKFTPDEQRNGKTPAEIMEQLHKLGIAGLADGFNPFIKCG